MNASQTAKTPYQLKLFPILTILGWILIMLALIIGLVVLTPTAINYFGANSKEVRDAAEAGSQLLSQISILASIPLWLEPLTFLGVAFFICGIALEFSVIPSLVKMRGDAMAKAFPLIVKLGS
ncbi:MAG: hypothetical protein ABUK20_08165 [Anaerolineales bacterium]|jgi:hypothetical protein